MRNIDRVKIILYNFCVLMIARKTEVAEKVEEGGSMMNNKVLASLILVLCLVIIGGMTNNNICGLINYAWAETENGIDPNEWPELASLGLSFNTMLDLYRDYEAAFESYPEDFEEGLKYEEQISQDAADKYNITPEQADLVYGYVLMHYDQVMNGGDTDDKEYTLMFGKLLSVTTNGSTVVIKAKIGPSGTNDLTIKQNYFNVCDLIRNQGLNIYEEVQYWAVADMTDGSESKVISFTVPKQVINIVAGDRFPDNSLGNYVDDLWILPSLLK